MFFVFNSCIDSSDYTIFENEEPVPEPEILTGETVPVKDENNIDIILSAEERIQIFISDMTMEQKIGQMFFCAFRRDETGGGIIEINNGTEQMINDYGIGGVVLFSENIRDEEQITGYIYDLQQASDIPLFIGIDEEGGRVLRTGSLDVPRIPPALSIGKTGDTQNAYNTAKTIAGYLKPLGFNIDFAPVADVYTNPSNTVIGDRAFSTEPHEAGEMVKNFTEGLLENGILPVLKHFPGHGDTNADSHYGIAATEKTLEELTECEFIPFQTGIDAGAAFVMTGHISAPNADFYGNILPACFSSFLLRDILRDTLGFGGIIITDALDMGAVSLYYTSEETAVKSVLAGVDMLLMPQNFKEAYDGLINAVESGEITEERINESVTRILTAKYNAGMIDLSEIK